MGGDFCNLCDGSFRDGTSHLHLHLPSCDTWSVTQHFEVAIIPCACVSPHWLTITATCVFVKLCCCCMLYGSLLEMRFYEGVLSSSPFVHRMLLSPQFKCLIASFFFRKYFYRRWQNEQSGFSTACTATLVEDTEHHNIQLNWMSYKWVPMHAGLRTTDHVPLQMTAKHAALYSANSEHLSQSTACSAPADAGVISDKLEKGSCDVPPDLQSYACLQTTNNQIWRSLFSER